MTTNRDALNYSTMWMQSAGGETGQPPLPVPPARASAMMVGMASASSECIRFASSIVRQEVDLGKIIRKEIDERAVTYDVIRREFVYRDDSDGILTHVTIPCGEGCTQIMKNRYIEVRMKRNCSKNLSVCFYPTDISVLRKLVAAVKENRKREFVAVVRPNQNTRPYRRSRWNSRERFPSTGSEESFSGGSPAPQLLEQSRDESNSTKRGFDKSFSTTALMPYLGVPQPQQLVKSPATPTIPKHPNYPKNERRSDVPVAEPKPEKLTLGGTGQSATSSVGSCQFELGKPFQTKLHRDERHNINLICSCKPLCAKKETKKCQCLKTGDMMYMCMHCRYVVKLGNLGQFECCGKKCATASPPALMEELIGSSNLVYRCKTCSMSMEQVP